MDQTAPSVRACSREARDASFALSAVQEQIKRLLTGLMLSTPPLVRAQLSEALSVISSHDFPTEVGHAAAGAHRAAQERGCRHRACEHFMSSSSWNALRAFQACCFLDL